MYEMMKKKGKGMSEDKKMAKLEALKDLRSFANDLLGDDLKSLKKVTVASDTPEGLEAGLEKAEEIVKAKDEEEAEEEMEDMQEEEMGEEYSASNMAEMVAMMDEEEKMKLMEMLQG